MAEVFDIFNPQISKVISGLGGKIITIYGISGTGKTYQCSRMSKPLFLCFEEGLNAIGGKKVLPVHTWADFIKYNNQLTGKSTVEKAREMYDTIICDSIDAMENICLEYICGQNGVRTIGDIPHGAGYKLYETTFWKEVNKITKAGYTIVFIGHPQQDINGFISIKGDQKRTVDPIIARSDITAYLQNNGVGEDGKPLHSSAWLCQTADFFARSRFTEIIPYIEDFTAENLEKAIIEAIEKEGQISGKENIMGFDEYAAMTKVEKKTFDQLMEELNEVGMKIAQANKMEDLTYIVESHLGAGGKVSELKRGSEATMEVILMELQELAATL